MIETIKIEYRGWKLYGNHDHMRADNESSGGLEAKRAVIPGVPISSWFYLRSGGVGFGGKNYQSSLEAIKAWVDKIIKEERRR